MENNYNLEDLNAIIEASKKFDKARKEATELVKAWKKDLEMSEELDSIYEAEGCSESWMNLYHAKKNLQLRIRERVKKYFTILHGTEDNIFLQEIKGTDYIDHYMKFRNHAKDLFSIYDL